MVCMGRRFFQSGNAARPRKQRKKRLQPAPGPEALATVGRLNIRAGTLEPKEIPLRQPRRLREKARPQPKTEGELRYAEIGVHRAGMTWETF